MFLHRKIMAILGAGIFMIAVPFTSMASSDTIHDVSINIDSGRDGNDVDVNVTTDSSMYHVDEVSVASGADIDWSDGDQPILEVRLKADDNYTFSYVISNEHITIGGTKGTVVGGRVNNSDLTVFIALSDVYKYDNKYELNVCDLNVSELEWDDMHGIARWSAAGDAEKYEVQLYRGSQSVTSALTTENTSYDFSDHISKAGSYTYKVRAISNTSLKGRWKKSESWRVSSEDASKISSGGSADTLAGPGSRSNGLWLKGDKGWKYQNADKRDTISNWQYINGNWYYFNELGYMVTGWINWKTKWYYCGDDGAMDTNITTPDGYHVGNDGAWTGS